MKLLALVPAALLLLAGCGDTCNTSPAPVDTTQLKSGCSGVSAGNVTIQIPICPTCADTGATCDGEIVGNEIHLNPVVQQCQQNAGCGVGCSFNPVGCPVTGLAAGTQYTVLFPTQTGAGAGSVQITTASGAGSTSCQL